MAMAWRRVLASIGGIRQNSLGAGRIESPERAACSGMGAGMGFRLTISRLLLLVGLVAVGTAALLAPSSMWLGAVSLMSAAIFLGGIVAAIYLDGPARAFWLGVVIFGLGYRALDLATGMPPRHTFAARWDSFGNSVAGRIGRAGEDQDRLSRHFVDSIGLRGRMAPLEVGEVVQVQRSNSFWVYDATVRGIKPDLVELEFESEMSLNNVEMVPLAKILRSDAARDRVYRIGEHLSSWIFGLIGGGLACRLRGRGLAARGAAAGGPGGS